MTRRNVLALIVILCLFAFAICALVFPLLDRQDMSLGLDLKGGIHLIYEADLSEIEPGDEAEIMEGVIAVITNRINPLGVTEPVINRLGEDRIVVELPELTVTDKDKERIGRTALLEFRELIIDENGEEQWVPATATINGQEKALNSSYFKENTYVGMDDFGRILLVFEWDEEGSKLSEEITGRLIGEPLGIFEGDEPLRGEDGKPIAPIVQSKITSRGQIEGLSRQEAENLSKQLNAGRLPVELTRIYEQTITPVLGADFAALSFRAGIIGIVLVMLFMILYYRLPGLLASLSLTFYGALGLAVVRRLVAAIIFQPLSGSLTPQSGLCQ